MIKKSLFVLTLGAMSAVYATSQCDEEDLKRGPNHFQTAPVLEQAHVKDGKTFVQGTLKSVQSTKFLIEFFFNPVNRNPITEGAVFLGQIEVKTNKKGDAKFCATLPCVCTSDPCVTPNERGFVSATATRVCDGHVKDTSQFSLNIPVH